MGRKCRPIDGSTVCARSSWSGKSFLAKRCDFIAMSGYCHDMLFVVCRLSVICLTRECIVGRRMKIGSHGFHTFSTSREKCHYTTLWNINFFRNIDICKSWEVFRNVGRLASEEVIYELARSKCLQILRYSLECYPLVRARAASNGTLTTECIQFTLSVFTAYHYWYACRSH